MLKRIEKEWVRFLVPEYTKGTRVDPGMSGVTGLLTSGDKICVACCSEIIRLNPDKGFWTYTPPTKGCCYICGEPTTYQLHNFFEHVEDRQQDLESLEYA